LASIPGRTQPLRTSSQRPSSITTFSNRIWPKELRPPTLQNFSQSMRSRSWAPS